ncbi:MAG: HEAT repeat domain-containing protein [Planctomycetes bacterium]|nr:HEAT repeat domain-containing protein [Planctomycetota bacterium]MCC7170586.1 HEAT repeat domain-containing protein [Planctomycetota bacterium]
MSRIVRFRPSSSRTPLRNTSGPALGLTVGFVALVVIAQKLGGGDEVKNLRELANEAPALYLREEAVLGLAEHGDESVVPDLVAMLDERNLQEMRLAADAALERLVGRSFGANEAAARAWLAQSGREMRPATSVGGIELAPWIHAVETEASPHAQVATSADDLVITVRGPLPPQFNLVLEHEAGSLLFECERTGDAYRVHSRDVPNSFRPLELYEPLVVPVRNGRESSGSDGSMTFSLPRLGCITTSTPPTALRMIVPSEG